MARMTCKMCGEEIEVAAGASAVVCNRCGTQQEAAVTETEEAREERVFFQRKSLPRP